MENLDSHVQNKHLSVSEDLVGKVERIESGKFAQISLTVDSRMRVDEKGLVHGGFAFGLADCAAIVAVNDPFVVLLSAQVRSLKPVKAGETLTARAQVQESEGKKRTVRCEFFNPVQEEVLEGEFLCLVLSRHVLEKNK
jgi:uncharacterized protein (TIGR00369 family)